MTSTTTEPAADAEAVRLAIEHLDRVAPEDWRHRIDLDALNLMSLADCVLGQIFRRNEYDYNGYGRGLDTLTDNDGNWPEEYDENVYANHGRYAAEWKRQIGISR